MAEKSQTEPEAEDKEDEKIDEEIIERTSPRGKVIYEAVYREGQHELERTNQALAWSGFAAGLSMGFSFLMEGLLRDHLPDTQWRTLIVKLGYSIGFLIVILGRQQLFTKNTLTVILPLLKQKTAGLFFNVSRLWLVVLLANLTGALAFAWVLAHSQIVDDSVRLQFSEIGRQSMENDFVTTMLRAIVAGWLIALMIWLLPFAESAHIWVIVLLSYLIGIAHLPHIIAGAVSSLYVVCAGEETFRHWLLNFFLPTFLGNSIGGVALVAMIAHAEFVKE